MVVRKATALDPPPHDRDSLATLGRTLSPFSPTLDVLGGAGGELEHHVAHLVGRLFDRQRIGRSADDGVGQQVLVTEPEA